MLKYLHLEFKKHMNTLFEQLLLGAIQGIAEWLPVSSEGMIILAKTALLKSRHGLETMVAQALFLHLGSVLAAMVYFRRDILTLLKSSKNILKPKDPDSLFLQFLLFTTIITGLVGIVLLKTLAHLVERHPHSTQAITLGIGACLLITALLQRMKKESGRRTKADITAADTTALGLVQGCAALPGLSRSGLTVSALLLRNFTADEAIRISFLMNIPVVILGNLVLNSGRGSFQMADLIGLAASFIFSMITIDILLKAAKKINFSWFLFLMAGLVILSAFLPH